MTLMIFILVQSLINIIERFSNDFNAIQIESKSKSLIVLYIYHCIYYKNNQHKRIYNKSYIIIIVINNC